MEISEKLKELKQGEEFSLSINKDIMEALAWINFRENSLNLTLEALRQNRYGFYDKELVMKTLSDLEDLRLDRIKIIEKVGETVLGESWRQILDETGCEFKIDEALPVIVFFKLWKTESI